MFDFFGRSSDNWSCPSLKVINATRQLCRGVFQAAVVDVLGSRSVLQLVEKALLWFMLEPWPARRNLVKHLFLVNDHGSCFCDGMPYGFTFCVAILYTIQSGFGGHLLQLAMDNQHCINVQASSILWHKSSCSNDLCTRVVQGLAFSLVSHASLRCDGIVSNEMRKGWSYCWYLLRALMSDRKRLDEVDVPNNSKLKGVIAVERLAWVIYDYVSVSGCTKISQLCLCSATYWRNLTISVLVYCWAHHSSRGGMR